MYMDVTVNKLVSAEDFKLILNDLSTVGFSAAFMFCRTLDSRLIYL